MRFMIPAPLLCAILSVMALALTPAPGWSQSGTLQMPPKAAPEAPPKPPAAAPRTPVQQVGPHAQTAPVVKPHGDSHAQKPSGSTAVHKPAMPEPPPAVTVPPPPTAPSGPTDKPATADGAVNKVKPLKTSGLPLPRFASLRSDNVNLRAGPGTRYRVDWEYHRHDLPVLIEREFEDAWRQVRDPDGIQGWVNQANLTGRRNFIIKGADAIVRADAKDSAAIVATFNVGVIGRIRACEKDSEWCQVQSNGHKGFLRRTQFWGALPNEEITR